MGGLFGGQKTQSQTTTAVSDLSVQTSTFGKAVALMWGTTRITGNLIWYGNFQSHAHSSGGSSGGKGGGGSSGGSTSYTYSTSFAMGLCEGEIKGIGAVYASKEVGTLAGYDMSVMTGQTPQSPWSYLTSAFPAYALGYSGLAYAAASNYGLGSNTSLPNFSFEVKGKLSGEFNSLPDALPASVAVDFLTNQLYGAGFPAAKIGDLTAWDAFTKASGLLVSPVLDTAKPAQQFIDDLCQATCSAPVWASTVLKIVPYADQSVTGNGVTFTPSATPIYDLTDDDFIDDGSTDPITVKRGNPADAYNSISVEYLDRTNQYNTATETAKDQASIDLYGLRPGNPIQLHMITTAAVAQQVAQLQLQRSCYVRNTYEFTLGWRYCLLEPMDTVTISDAWLGLSKYPVRITEIEEDAESGYLKITAEDFPDQVSTPSINSVAVAARYAQNYNIDPGSVNAPVIFEAPDLLTTAGYEVWVAASGVDSSLYGGCNVWVSTDGDSFKQVGTITGSARHGFLSSALASGEDPDTVNSFGVDLSVSGGTLTGGSKSDADNFNTLCFVGGELIAFESAALTAANQYLIGTYLRRGAYGTKISAHAAGERFARLDGAIFKYAYDSALIGQTIYVKCQAFNIYGGGTQSLADCQAYQYIVTGSTLLSPLPNVSNLRTNYVSGLTTIYWDAISDVRSVDYEIRMGPSWSSGKTLGRATESKFTAVGDGKYWIAARYQAADGTNVYSATPQGVEITGASLASNVVASFNESSAGWKGAVSGGAVVLDGCLMLGPGGNVLSVPNILALGDVLWFGGVSSSGVYQLPEVVDVGRVASCTVTISYAARGAATDENVLTMSDVLSVSDFLGDALGQKVTVTPQIAVAGSDGVYGDWQDYTPGVYSARYFKARVLLATSSDQVTPVVSDLVFTVDVPDRTDNYQVTTTAAGATAIGYSSAFNSGPGSLSLPAIQATIISAQSGDDVIIGSQTLSSCTVEVLNGGAPVARTVCLQVQGY